jgi:predicted dithiol-disulfide oxidoreductase (DUF899 family)
LAIRQRSPSATEPWSTPFEGADDVNTHRRPHCPDCTGFTSQFTRLEFLDDYDARFVIVTQGPIDEALAYRDRVGNTMTWYSSAHSSFGADMGAPPGGGLPVNVFLPVGDPVYRMYNTDGAGHRAAQAPASRFDLLPDGRQEEWQDSPEGWPPVAHLQPMGPIGGVRSLRRAGLTGAPDARRP